MSQPICVRGKLALQCITYIYSYVEMHARTQDAYQPTHPPLSYITQVQTFDVTKQQPGPRWTLRQWCLYWKDRNHQTMAWNAGGGGGGMRPGGMSQSLGGGPGGQPGGPEGPQASNAALQMGSAASSGGQDGGSEEDEADSAFVHQG